MAGGEHAMARNDDRDRVPAIGLADGARAPAGDTAGDAVRDVAERLPDAPLVNRTGRCDRQVEIGQLTVQVGMQLIDGPTQQCSGLLPAPPTPVDGYNCPILFRE